MQWGLPWGLDDWVAGECPPRPGESLPEAVARHQLVALNAILHHARRSPFYGERLSGFAELPSLVALAALPFTVSADLADWGRLLCVSQGEVARMVTVHSVTSGLAMSDRVASAQVPPRIVMQETSGTTGPPKRLAFTEGDLARTRSFFRAGMAQLVRPGDRLAVLLPGADRPDGVTDLLRQALSEATVTAATLETMGHSESVPERLPEVLVLLPEQLRVLLETGRLTALSGVRGVLTSGAVLSEDLRRESLNRLPGCCFLDHYGLTESGFGGGVECPAHAGYHLREPDLVVEIVDAAGNVLPAGEWGEVVITTLHREAMPLIRYRTGDRSRLLPGPCACGSPLARLDRIQGRVHEQGGWKKALARKAPVTRRSP